MSNIDPIQYGSLISKVDTLEKQVDNLTEKVDQLLELANKSKGGFWMGMAVASSVGGFVGWVVSNMPFIHGR